MFDPKAANKSPESGFSLVELLIAMSISLVIMGVASTLLATSFKIRSRENARTDSIADVQRALNIIAREVAIGGYGFDPSSNGLVSGDSDASSIRVRSNLNRYSAGSMTIESENEDIKYFVDTTNDQNYLVRYDRFATGQQATVLANRIDDLDIIYWSPTNTALDVAADPSQVANAIGVRITVAVDLPAVGMPGSPGYQPATVMRLTSDVTLRNKSQNLTTY
ncbi:MAG TPA: prepilin-type N-terminal cleavage/methylation domain-containing protein [Pyrinomonadaceae bacterium]|nr:prepilin-type N-terminal cleavage/methylation domain-containing protein [Pyrinomonadaceae bacterium]